MRKRLWKVTRIVAATAGSNDSGSPSLARFHPDRSKVFGLSCLRVEHPMLDLGERFAGNSFTVHGNSRCVALPDSESHPIGA
jgi:hypothetical protein